jgi:hypothetical protein
LWGMSAGILALWPQQQQQSPASWLLAFPFFSLWWSSLPLTVLLVCPHTHCLDQYHWWIASIVQVSPLVIVATICFRNHHCNR